jgi:hypothetical protein
MRSVITAILVALLFAGPVFPADPVVPVAVQLAVFAKVWTLDRTFPSPGRVTMAVLYQSGNPASDAVRDDIETATASIPGLRCVFIDLDRSEVVATRIQPDVSVIYVAPLRGYDIGELTRLARIRGIRTMTGVREYVDAGVAVGLAVRNDRPLILINLAASRAEGSEYSSQLLKLARIVGEEAAR